MTINVEGTIGDLSAVKLPGTTGGEGDSLVRGKVVAEHAGIGDLHVEAPASVIGSVEIEGTRLA